MLKPTKTTKFHNVCTDLAIKTKFKIAEGDENVYTWLNLDSGFWLKLFTARNCTITMKKHRNDECVVSDGSPEDIYLFYKAIVRKVTFTLFYGFSILLKSALVIHFIRIFEVWSLKSGSLIGKFWCLSNCIFHWQQRHHLSFITVIKINVFTVSVRFLATSLLWLCADFESLATQVTLRDSFPLLEGVSVYLITHRWQHIKS